MKYLKRLQRDGIYHYVRLHTERKPPLSEVVNFLNPVPIVQQQEYDLATASSRIDYQAFFEAWEPISQAEFTAAYERATSGEFSVYVDGKRVAL